MRTWIEAAVQQRVTLPGSPGRGVVWWRPTLAYHLDRDGCLYDMTIWAHFVRTFGAFPGTASLVRATTNVLILYGHEPTSLGSGAINSVKF